MPAGQKDHNISFLTERQKEIMRMRRKNLKKAEIAKILNITRQDVTILEKRAMINIEKAFNTIEMAYEEGLSVRVELRKDIQILDAIKEILAAGDREKIRIKSSIPEIFTILKICQGSNIKNGIIQKGTEASILPDGSLKVRQINDW